jgi:sortase A
MRASALRFLSLVLILTGILLVADAVVTLVWQEPLSSLLAKRSQDRLAGQLDKLERATLQPAEAQQLKALPDTRRRMAYAARQLQKNTPDGGAIGRIEMPTLHKSYVVVNGDDPDDLRKGPGAYPDTPLPGRGGTTAIAGHRTTYLAPFRDIDQLKRGDTITLKMPYGRFTYRVEGHQIVKPTDVGVVKPVGYERLVLTACHPLYSAAERIVVSARLIRTVPSQRIADVGPASTGR